MTQESIESGNKNLLIGASGRKTCAIPYEAMITLWSSLTVTATVFFVPLGREASGVLEVFGSLLEGAAFPFSH